MCTVSNHGTATRVQRVKYKPEGGAERGFAPRGLLEIKIAAGATVERWLIWTPAIRTLIVVTNAVFAC